MRGLYVTTKKVVPTDANLPIFHPQTIKQEKKAKMRREGRVHISQTIRGTCPHVLLGSHVAFSIG